MSAKKTVRKTISFGDLVALAFDVASSYSDDPKEVSVIAANAVNAVLSTRRSALPEPNRASVFNGVAVEISGEDAPRTRITAQAA